MHISYLMKLRSNNTNTCLWTLLDWTWTEPTTLNYYSNETRMHLFKNAFEGIRGKFGERLQDLWNWLLILPKNVSLLVTTLRKLQLIFTPTLQESLHFFAEISLSTWISRIYVYQDNFGKLVIQSSCQHQWTIQIYEKIYSFTFSTAVSKVTAKDE